MKSGMSDCSAWAELVKSSVSALDAGRVLGLEMNHDGRCRCPFHNGEDFNMKLYMGDKGYHCFVCHEHGDVIALVQKMSNSTFTEAIQWLSDTFHLGIDTHAAIDEKTRQRASRQRRIRQELNERRKETDRRVYDTFLNIADFVRTVERTVEDNAPKSPDDEWSETFCAALRVRTEANELAEQAQMMILEKTY